MAPSPPPPRSRAVDTAFGQVLRAVRTERGLSQELLAHESGSGRTYVSQLERGERGASLKTIFNLATTLNVHPSHLVRLVEDHLGTAPRR